MGSREITHDALRRLGSLVQQRIPTMTYNVDRDVDYGWGILHMIYPCPCGEESSYFISSRALQDMIDVSGFVDHVVEKFREHVIREGNVPDFK